MKPLPKLSFDLNLVDLCVSGFCFFRSCYRVTEPTENYVGQNVGLFCTSPLIKWNPPIFEPQEIKNRYENQKTSSPV